MVIMMMMVVMILIMMMASPWLESCGGELAQRNNCDQVDSKLCLRDSKLRQMLMASGKLSNQVPSVKSRLNGSCYSST